MSKRDLDTMMEPGDSDEENDTVIRFKWLADGCATIDEIIERLQLTIKSYENLKTEGWELRRPIDDDYGFLVKRDKAPEQPPPVRAKSSPMF